MGPCWVSYTCWRLPSHCGPTKSSLLTTLFQCTDVSCVRSRVVARMYYYFTCVWGNLPLTVPDAFVFKPRMVRETGLKINHTFRVCVPQARCIAQQLDIS